MQSIRVLIVEPSAAIQMCLRRWFAPANGFSVCGQTGDANWALLLTERARPDLVTLDLEMPGAMELLRRFRAHHPELPVVALVPPTLLGGMASIEALAEGAGDCLARPHAAHVMKAAFGRQLLSRARSAARANNARTCWTAPQNAQPASDSCAAVLIGSSTGGPEALATLLPDLTELPVPVLIVQHMPPPFPKVLAEHLTRVCDVPVGEAKNGQMVGAGDIVLAPGDRHLQIASALPNGGLRLALNAGAPVNYCRPAVDLLFSSAAEVLGSGVLAVMLSGMGCDGTRGAALLHAEGATVLAQDEQTSAVWGMPGSVVRAGIANQVLPISAIAMTIRRALRLDESSLAAVPIPPASRMDGIHAY